MLKNFKNIAVLAIFFVIALCAGLMAANGAYISNGDVVTLTWATTSPTAGDIVVKGTTKAGGAICGIALNGTATANERVSVATKGVVYGSVTASSTVGSIGVGDYIYSTITASEVCTVSLSNVSSGILVGKALETVTASTTAGVYSTIKILLCQPGHL